MRIQPVRLTESLNRISQPVSNSKVSHTSCFFFVVVSLFVYLEKKETYFNMIMCTTNCHGLA